MPLQCLYYWLLAGAYRHYGGDHNFCIEDGAVEGDNCGGIGEGGSGGGGIDDDDSRGKAFFFFFLSSGGWVKNEA